MEVTGTPLRQGTPQDALHSLCADPRRGRNGGMLKQQYVARKRVSHDGVMPRPTPREVVQTKAEDATLAQDGVLGGGPAEQGESEERWAGGRRVLLKEAEDKPLAGPEWIA